MPERPTASAPRGPLALAEQLLSTLQQEQVALDHLSAYVEQQLAALRVRQQEAIAEATTQASEAMNELDRLRQLRERQARLLGRVLHVEADPNALTALAEALAQLPEGEATGAQLLDVRSRVRERAATTRQHCSELAFALQYAVQLGHEMIQALQGLDAPPPARVYTARGETTQGSSPRSFLNKVG